ncbi:MAG: RDD family protein [Candidatus Rokuibacteriota bacterium]
MSSSCPNCGWPRVEGTACPRCGVDVARYRAEMAALAGAAPDASTIAAVPATATVPAATTLVTATTAVGAAIRPAGFWIRVGALLVDVVCVMAAELVFGLLTWTLEDDRLATATARAFRFLAGPCYFVLFHWARGQTLGKMAFGIRVVDLPGGPLSLGQAVLRHLGSWFSALILGIGYLFAAFRADKRGLHDLIARTRVEHVT